MRCLYCGKELALLKRLTGGGEFCSEAHKQSYQEEYNRLGLSRLLQARSRAGESKAAKKAPPVQAVPVAVAEPVVEAIAAEKVVPAPLPPPPEVIAAPEPPPPAIAGFVMETQSISVPPEPVSYLEPWIADEATPPKPAWCLEGPSGEHPVFTLRSAELLPLEVQPGACESNCSVMETNVTPKEFGHPRVNLSIPLTVTWSREFQPGGSIAIEIAPRPSESNCYASLNGALDFSYPVGVQSYDLLDLSPAGIAYPAEDCDVTIPGSWTNGVISEAAVDIPVDITVPAIPSDAPGPEMPAEAATAGIQDATPRAALEALSRLHQDMREREEATPAVAPAEAASGAGEAAAKSAVEPAEPAPREASELLAISLKSFAPPKAGPLIDASALLTNGHPLLPRLKALPLRPKVAPAPQGFGQQPRTAPAQNPPVEPKAKAAQSSAPAQVRQKPPAADKTAQTEQTPKPAQTGTPKAPQPTQAKKAGQPAEAAKAKQPAQATPAAPPVQIPAQPQQTAKPIKPEQPAKLAPAAASGKSAETAPKPQPIQPPKAAPATAGVSGTPAKPEPVRKAPAAKEEPASKAAPAGSALAASAPAASADDAVPNFGAVVNTSMFGSLKVKAGIAALAAVIAVGAYFGFASKSTQPSASSAKSSDGVGPSIMVGEGGWVEGWAGDPLGLHAGRQITIYRPSLKLTDYRIEFQGQIETKSMGWIFRAADPDNYYAMKLELISPELPLQLALYKYLVLKGRQVQVGRVPIDVPVKNDTVFSIRVDVRGPKFNTYVQGQPVDVWTDDQLRSGGVGFLNERGERGKIKSVALSYLSGGTK